MLGIRIELIYNDHISDREEMGCIADVFAAKPNQTDTGRGFGNKVY